MKEGEHEGDAGLAGRVIGLGRAGRGRAEIAAALGLELAELARREAGDAGLAQALRLAAESERAWWEALPREALAAGAPFSVTAWLGAMRWRFGDDAGAAGPARAAKAPATAAEPPRPTVRYYIPDNLMERSLPDGTPLTPALRRERAIAQCQVELDHAERALARSQAEVAQWRSEMRWVEARNYDPDAEEEDDWEEDDPDEDDPDEEDWDEDGRDEGEAARDERRDEEERLDDQGDDDGQDGDGADDARDDGDDGDDHDDGDRGDGGDRGDAGDAGADGRLSAGAAGCERTLPAGVAGPPAWAAQPHLGAGDAPHPQALRDAAG